MTGRKVHSGKVPAPWMQVVNSVEKQRLAVINDRLLRKYTTIKELEAERRMIMRRAIRRQRRARGKN